MRREWPGELSYAAHLSRCLYRVVLVQLASLRHPLRSIASLLLFTRDDVALRSFRKADALLRHESRQTSLPPRRLPSVHRLSQALLHPMATGAAAERAAHLARLSFLTSHWHAWITVALAAYRVEDGVDYERICRLAKLPCVGMAATATATGGDASFQTLSGGGKRQGKRGGGGPRRRRSSSHDAATTHGGAHHNLTWDALRLADPAATARARQLAEQVGYV